MYYSPSGKFTPLSFLWFLILSISIFPIIGLIYTYAIWYIPFIYVNFFITAGFGCLVGISIGGIVIHYGKVRNVPIAALFGFVGSIIALYCSWAVWVDMVANAGESYGNRRIGITISNISIQETIGLLLNPAEVLRLAMEINENGTWGLLGHTISGIVLAIIWLIEAIIVVVVGTMLPIWQAKTPFCEGTNTWAKSTSLPPMAFIEESQQFKSNLENGNYSYIENLPKALAPKNEKHSTVTLHYTPLGAYYLSVTNKMPKVEKGKVSFDEDVLVKYITVSSKVGNKLLGI